jgi:hypothetical protein
MFCLSSPVTPQGGLSVPVSNHQRVITFVRLFAFLEAEETITIYEK